MIFHSYICFILVCLLTPLIYLCQLFTTPFFEQLDQSFIRLTFNSITSALVTSILALSIAIPLAFLFCRYQFILKKYLFIIFCLPLIIPSYILAASYKELALPFGIEISGFWGNCFILALANYPLAFLFISNTLRQYDHQLDESSFMLGYNKWQTFYKVTFWQILPALSSSGIIISLYTLSDFGTPSLMNFATFTREIKICYDLALLEKANTITSILIIIAFIFILFSEKFRRRQQTYSNNTIKHQFYPIHKLTNIQQTLFLICSSFLLIIIFLPFYQIFNWFQQGIASTEASFSQFYNEIFNSVYLSFTTALLSILFCFPCAYFDFCYRNSKLNKIISIINFLGNAIPGIALAFCMIFLFRQTPLYQSFSIIIFALILRFFTQAYNPLKNSLEQIHLNHYESAQLLGKNSWQIFWSIIFPQIKNSLTISFGIIFIFVFKELAITLLLSPLNFNTLPQQIWDYIDEGEFSQIGIPIFSIIFISSFLLIHIFYSQKFEQKAL